MRFRWAAGTEGGVHGRIGCLTALQLRGLAPRRRRFTLAERVADWLIGGQYRAALDARDIAVQTAATRPLRAREDAVIGDGTVRITRTPRR